MEFSLGQIAAKHIRHLLADFGINVERFQHFGDAFDRIVSLIGTERFRGFGRDPTIIKKLNKSLKHVAIYCKVQHFLIFQPTIIKPIWRSRSNIFGILYQDSQIYFYEIWRVCVIARNPHELLPTSLVKHKLEISSGSKIS